MKLEEELKHFRLESPKIIQVPEGKEEQEWVPIDYKLTPVEKYIKDELIKYNLVQMAPPVIFNLSLGLGRGFGLFVLAPLKGVGKTKSIQIALSSLPTPHLWIDYSFTPAGICSRGLDRQLNNARINIGCDDLNTFLTNDLMMSTFLMISQLLFTGQFNPIARGLRPIQNCDLVFMGAGTTHFIRELMNMGIFSGQAQDRFLRYYMFYTQEPIGGSKGTPTLAINPSPSVSYRVSEKMELECVGMLSSQLSPNRALIFTRNILMGHAMLCGKECADDEDAKWLLLYRPCIVIEPIFTFRITDYRYFYASEIQVRNALAEVLFCLAMGMDKEKIAKRLILPVGLVERAITYLEQMGLAKDGKIGGNFAKDLKQLHETFQ
jgi:hypothetical protein